MGEVVPFPKAKRIPIETDVRQTFANLVVQRNNLPAWPRPDYLPSGCESDDRSGR